MPKGKAKKAGKTKTAGRGDQTKRLREIPEISDDIRGPLAKLDIVRADQLTSAAGIQQVRGLLLQHLNCSDHDLDVAVAAATASLPAAAPGAQAPQPKQYSFGALRPPPQARAEAMSIPLTATKTARASLPASANLVSKMPPIRDQGKRGTCVAFTLTAIHEYENRATKADYSEGYLYYKAKQIDQQPVSCGTQQSCAAQILQDDGQCGENLWPYNPNGHCNDFGRPATKPNPDKEAAKHKLNMAPVNPHDIIAIKTAVAAGRPVGVSIPVYTSWYQSPTTDRTGRITMPIGTEAAIDGHCMCVVGYQDDGPSTVTPTPGGGFFILRNSWTTQWGRDCAYGAGYGTIPYGYIAAYNWESYTVAVAPPKHHKKRGHRKPAKKSAKKK